MNKQNAISDGTAAMDLSIVIPVLNEQDNVRPLFRQLRTVLRQMHLRYELIFVDDGSTDGTWDVLTRLYEDQSHVTAIRFARNFGQTAAMRAGIELARGERIVTIDGDLQNDPRDIPRLLRKMDEGFDLVIGWRKDRKDSLWLRTLPSRVANWLIGRVTGVHLHDNGCSLKAYRGDMIKQVPLYSEMHRFIPILSQLAGARMTEIVVRHHPRRHGLSKYGLSRVGGVLLDVFAIKMLVTCAKRPLHWFGALSLPFFIAATATAIGYVLVSGLHQGQPPLVVTSIAFFLFLYLGLHLLFIGLLAELIVKANYNSAENTARSR